MENRRPFRKEQSLAVQKEIYAAVPEERRNELAGALCLSGLPELFAGQTL